MSTPSDYGYAKCSRCLVQRPAVMLVEREWVWNHEDHGTIRMDGPICVDEAWCCSELERNERAFHPPVVTR